MVVRVEESPAEESDAVPVDPAESAAFSPLSTAESSAQLPVYPVFLRLEGRRVLLVGGGVVAAAKLPALLEAGAHVTIVGPVIGPELKRAAQTISPEQNGSAPTISPVLNASPPTISPVLNASAPTISPVLNASAPTISSESKHGGVTMVERAFEPADLNGVSFVVAAAPPQVNRAVALAAEARGLFVNAVDDAASASALRAAARLREADLVLYDALAGREALGLAPHARWFYVGKRARRRSIAQESIERLMVRAARRGERVVRLKCGDPFVLGRGGEEALALARAGIPYELVPGVTSAVAAPALAGIPVTHRGLPAGFAVVSGHAESAYAPLLSTLPPGAATVVVLMGLANRADIADLPLTSG